MTNTADRRFVVPVVSLCINRCPYLLVLITVHSVRSFDQPIVFLCCCCIIIPYTCNISSCFSDVKYQCNSKWWLLYSSRLHKFRSLQKTIPQSFQQIKGSQSIPQKQRREVRTPLRWILSERYLQVPRWKRNEIQRSQKSRGWLSFHQNIRVSDEMQTVPAPVCN